MRSPYAKRQVVVGQALTTAEKKLHEWSLSAFGDGGDCVFATYTGQKVSRDAVESLAANQHIFTTVIDGWADVLNYEEKFKSRESPRRLFLKTGLLAGNVLLYDMYSEEDRYNSFLQNLRGCVNYDEDVFNLRKVDMIFIPLKNGKNYYCVVVNIKNPALEILDSFLSEGFVDDIYDYDIHILHKMIVCHLREIGHVSARNLGKSEKVVVQMGWRSKKNGPDSGVFLMRHMETYMGGGLRGWTVGIARGGPVLQRQLSTLRMKYVTKMLTCVVNNKKDFVEEEICRLSELEGAAKQWLLDQANESWKYRLFPA